MNDLWPADRVVRVAVSTLIPAARNARTHSEAQVAQIAASIKEWGWTVPILLDEAGGIIAGHGRVLAARLLGIAEVPAMVAVGWTEVQKAAYRIADNKLALNAGWDDALLRIEFAELATQGFDLHLTGFSDLEVAGLTGSNSGLTDPDEVPEAPAAPVSRRGDLWRLGRHWLCCGDATNVEDVARALAGVQPHLMVTDPPYGVSYDPAWRDSAVKVEFVAKRAIGRVQNDESADWRVAWSLFPGDVAYIWHESMLGGVVAAGLQEAGFDLRSQIIWVKQHFILGRGDYHWQHETCWYAVRKGRNGHWGGDRSQATVWEIKAQIGWESARKDNPDKASGHGTQKPVECMKRPIENNSSPSHAVYDPFVGSGTTIIAAEMTGRSCHAIEISPAYCDVSIERWQNFTGEKATREGDGRSFDELAANPAVCAA
jgi:DNA modification methylase